MHCWILLLESIGFLFSGSFYLILFQPCFASCRQLRSLRGRFYLLLITVKVNMLEELIWRNPCVSLSSFLVFFLIFDNNKGILCYGKISSRDSILFVKIMEKDICLISDNNKTRCLYITDNLCGFLNCFSLKNIGSQPLQ